MRSAQCCNSGTYILGVISSCEIGHKELLIGRYIHAWHCKPHPLSMTGKFMSVQTFFLALKPTSIQRELKNTHAQLSKKIVEIYNK